jgi:hypothetical protein
MLTVFGRHIILHADNIGLWGGGGGGGLRSAKTCIFEILVDMTFDLLAVAIIHDRLRVLHSKLLVLPLDAFEIHRPLVKLI